MRIKWVLLIPGTTRHNFRAWVLPYIIFFKKECSCPEEPICTSFHYNDGSAFWVMDFTITWGSSKWSFNHMEFWLCFGKDMNCCLSYYRFRCDKMINFRYVVCELGVAKSPQSKYHSTLANLAHECWIINLTFSFLVWHLGF